jgi:hypothetical protein
MGQNAENAKSWLMAGWTPEGCSVELTKDQGLWKTTIDAAGVAETRRGESEVERAFEVQQRLQALEGSGPQQQVHTTLFTAKLGESE